MKIKKIHNTEFLGEHFMQKILWWRLNSIRFARQQVENLSFPTPPTLQLLQHFFESLKSNQLL